MATWLILLLASPFVGRLLGMLVRRLAGGTPILAPSAPDFRVPFPTAIELAAIGVAVCALWVDGDTPRSCAGCLLGWSLLALAWIDWTRFRLPMS